jgi:hypothetical protein
VLAAGPTSVRMEPYLSGDRTSLKQRRASYRGINLGSTRDDFLQATCSAIVRAPEAALRGAARLAWMGLESGGPDRREFRFDAHA